MPWTRFTVRLTSPFIYPQCRTPPPSSPVAGACLPPLNAAATRRCFPLLSPGRHGAFSLPRPCPAHPPSYARAIAARVGAPSHLSHRPPRATPVPEPTSQLGWASRLRPRAESRPSTVLRFSSFSFSFKDSRNSYKLLKYVENVIRLRKIQNKFL
jgi:hypothetical protein